MNEQTNSEQIQEPIRIAELSKEAGEADEMQAKDRARFRLAGWVLLALFALVCIALVFLVFSPDDRHADAVEFFAFIKSAVPPLVTLILGFWFHAQSE